MRMYHTANTRIYNIIWCTQTHSLTHTHSNVCGRVHSIIIIAHRARRRPWFTVREIVICCRLRWSPTARSLTARQHPATLISAADASTCNAILYVCSPTFYMRRMDRKKAPTESKCTERGKIEVRYIIISVESAVDDENCIERGKGRPKVRGEEKERILNSGANTFQLLVWHSKSLARF
jgi:hypothetical protein